MDDDREYPHREITEKIIGAAFEVWRILGYGFLERVYENALAIELAQLGFTVAQQDRIRVMYKGTQVGFYKPDLMIDGKVLIELKADKALNLEHQAQILNCLKATSLRIGLLLNFGQKKCEPKRFIM